MMIAVVALLLVASGCSKSESEQALDTSSGNVATTTQAPPTTDSEPVTTEACSTKCPLDDETAASVEAIVDAYNGGNWDDFTRVLQDPEPEWDTTAGPQNPDLVRFDFLWSTAMNEVWTLGECFEANGSIVCDVIMEDDLHRGLSSLGLPVSECRLFLRSDDAGGLEIIKYELFPCHAEYDVAMHAYGDWFERTYPDLDPIAGFHYRGWNQTDETAGPRAAAHLEEYVASGEAELGEPSSH